MPQVKTPGYHDVQRQQWDSLNPHFIYFRQQTLDQEIDKQLAIKQVLTFMLCPATIAMAKLLPNEAICWKIVAA